MPAELQSREHRDLLDTMDTLRSQGISQFVDLPQLQNKCTGYPWWERRDQIWPQAQTDGFNVSIIPGPERTEDEKARIKAWVYGEDFLDIGLAAEGAKDVMGLNGSERVFSTDILRIEVSGPNQPHLTIVDLPGLFMAEDRNQSIQDSDLVKNLVRLYMKSPRSVILAVVSAKNEFANQQVTQLARELDPKGFRTLGLITKPDTLDKGSDGERFYVDLARNKNVTFRLGWHVVRNRKYGERYATTYERDETEIDFFSSGAWTSLDASQLGMAAIRTRLSNVLRDQILKQLPSVLEEVEKGIRQCEDRLVRLGAERTTKIEQRKYLVKISSEFTRLLTAAVDGTYVDEFFGASESDEMQPRRLRSAVQNALSDFAEEMRINGHANIIQDTEPSDDEDPRVISRSDYVTKVKALMRKTRGRELPGSYNPLLGLIRSLVDDIHTSAYTTVNLVLQHVSGEETTGAIIRDIISPSMDHLKEVLAGKVDEILKPHLLGHAITYNHYLTESVQKAQAARHRCHLGEGLRAFFDQDDFDQGNKKYQFDMESLLNSLASDTEPDMDRLSSSTAADMMEAYYEVALKRVVDDVSVLVIENCLVQKLLDLFSPDVVWNLTDEIVFTTAAEGEASAAERGRTTHKLRVLESGRVELNKLRKHGSS
ncbi:P-loop containing nucleoside triphosphate hydrolase protein [Xylariaceae sp. FL0016]|nr:P-loop containing nucleoside triphosphate hydrolase protein [Xylariaceae sp. FL0016]